MDGLEPAVVDLVAAVERMSAALDDAEALHRECTALGAYPPGVGPRQEQRIRAVREINDAHNVELAKAKIEGRLDELRTVGMPIARQIDRDARSLEQTNRATKAKIIQGDRL